MQQLSGLDQLFLAINSKTTNAVFGCLVLFETPEAGQSLPDEAFMRTRLAERIPHLPPLHRVVVPIPFGLDYPYFATADRIDLGSHLRTVRLPSPGTQEQLATEVSLLMSTDLPPGRPLWDLTVFEGLPGGGLAHLLRIDHTVIDGSTLPLLWDLLSDDPAEPLGAPLTSDWPEPLFGKAEMLARGVVGALTYPLRVIHLQSELLSWWSARLSQDHLTTAHQLAAKLLPGELGKAVASSINPRQRANGQPDVTPILPSLWPPATPLNGRLSARRSTAFCTVPLADVKAVSQAFDTTVNNVVAAMATGALRRFLQERDGLPQRPLIACCPISLRTGHDPQPWSNILFMMMALLPTNLTDPGDRLRAVSDNLTLAKCSFDELPTHLLRQASSLLPSAWYTVPIQVLSRTPHRFARAPWNVVVSNVNGSRRATFLNGLRIRGYAPISFLTVGGGMNISLLSHEQTLTFTFVGAAELVGDLWPMARYMPQELQALQDAAAALPRPTGPRRSRSRAATTDGRSRVVQIVS